MFCDFYFTFCFCTFLCLHCILHCPNGKHNKMYPPCSYISLSCFGLLLAEHIHSERKRKFCHWNSILTIIFLHIVYIFTICKYSLCMPWTTQMILKKCRPIQLTLWREQYPIMQIHNAFHFQCDELEVAYL